MEKKNIHLGVRPKIPLHYLQFLPPVWVHPLWSDCHRCLTPGKRRRPPSAGNYSSVFDPWICSQLTQMLLFAGCHCAVLFRGRTNRRAAVSLSLPPDSGSSGLSVQLPQGSISAPRRTHWIRPGGTHTHTHTHTPLKRPRLALAKALRSRAATAEESFSSPWDQMIQRKLLSELSGDTSRRLREQIDC